MSHRHPHDDIPDVRDGLTRVERIVLFVLAEAQRERNGRAVPTALLYGRVLEYVDLSEAELQACLRRLSGRADEPPPRSTATVPRVHVTGDHARID
jgi:hypothetical protein